MPEFSIKLLGNKKTQDMFASLPEKVARKVVRKSTNAASAVVRKELRKTMPKDEGKSKKSIASKVITSKDKTKITGIIGVNRKKEIDGEKRGRVFHLIENDHIAVDGSLVPGSHALRQAMINTESERKEAYGKKMMEEIDKETAKLGAKGNEK